MKLCENRKFYYELSGKASNASHSLFLAGIAVVWIFKVGASAAAKPQPELLLPMLLLTTSLACDLSQYISGTIISATFSRRHERALSNKAYDPDLVAHSVLNWPALEFFSLKMIAALLSYALLICRFYNDRLTSKALLARRLTICWAKRCATD